MRLAEKWEKLSTLQQAAGRSAALGEISMSELSATRHSGLWKNQPKLFLFPLGAAAQGSGLSAVAQLSDVAPGSLILHSDPEVQHSGSSIAGTRESCLRRDSVFILKKFYIFIIYLLPINALKKLLWT